jgi:hypothetical protein
MAQYSAPVAPAYKGLNIHDLIQNSDDKLGHACAN